MRVLDDRVPSHPGPPGRRRLAIAPRRSSRPERERPAMTTSTHSRAADGLAEHIRGALELERTSDGLLPHRLPASAWSQCDDPQLSMAEAQPSGVRLVLRTRARVLELDALRARLGYSGMPLRPGRAVRPAGRRQPRGSRHHHRRQRADARPRHRPARDPQARSGRRASQTCPTATSRSSSGCRTPRSASPSHCDPTRRCTLRRRAHNGSGCTTGARSATARTPTGRRRRGPR